LELQAGQAVGDRIRPRAVVPGQMHPQEAELGQALAHLSRELAALEPLAHAGQDLASNERSDGIADVSFLVGEEAIDREEVERIDPGGGHRSPSLPLIERRTFSRPVVDTARRSSPRTRRNGGSWSGAWPVRAEPG